MEYEKLAIGIVAAVLVICVVAYAKRRKGNVKKPSGAKRRTALPKRVPGKCAQNEIAIAVEPLPAEVNINKANMTEITDSRVIARVNQLVPGLLQAGNAAGNAVRAGGEVLYQAIIPAGGQLINSREVPGALRAITSDGKHITGHANLVPVERTGAAVANTAASVMSVASMVVGQYYMARIYKELSQISDRISNIANFQSNEYMSKVLMLTSEIKRMATFQVEIVENNELRQNEIAHLYILEKECAELLGQANLTIAGFANKVGIDYQQYTVEIAEAEKWCIYQRALFEMLYQISDLKHALYLGTVSKEHCNALLSQYAEQVKQAQQALALWHENIAKSLGIELASERRKRVGLDEVLYKIPGLFNDDMNYCPIPNEIVKTIQTQTSGCITEPRNMTADLFCEDVRLIAIDGRIYYFPSETGDVEP